VRHASIVPTSAKQAARAPPWRPAPKPASVSPAHGANRPASPGSTA